MQLDDLEAAPLLVPLTPLEAYRRDARQPTLDESASEPLSSWLAVAVMLRRYADSEASERPVLHAELQLLLRRANAGETQDEDLGAAVRNLALVAEDAGAQHLAFSILALNESVHATDTLERGRSLAQRARIARKAGNLEIATNLYREVELLGKQSKLRELLSRAYLGYGLLAFHRGGYPDARQWFARAVTIADDIGVADVSSMAHHGLMIAAGVAGELEEALVEGWTAFKCAAGDKDREGEMLSSLGQILLEGGQAQSSLFAFAAALQRTALARITLPAWGGLAVAASQIDDVALVERAASEIARLTKRHNLPYPAVSAHFDLAVAYERVGRRALAEKHRRQALSSAKHHGFHEFVYRAESLGDTMAAAVVASRPFTSAGLDVLAELRHLGGLEALASRS